MTKEDLRRSLKFLTVGDPSSSTIFQSLSNARGQFSQRRFEADLDISTVTPHQLGDRVRSQGMSLQLPGCSNRKCRKLVARSFVARFLFVTRLSFAAKLLQTRSEIIRSEVVRSEVIRNNLGSLVRDPGGRSSLDDQADPWRGGSRSVIVASRYVEISKSFEASHHNASRVDPAHR